MCLNIFYFKFYSRYNIMEAQYSPTKNINNKVRIGDNKKKHITYGSRKIKHYGDSK